MENDTEQTAVRGGEQHTDGSIDPHGSMFKSRNPNTGAELFTEQGVFVADGNGLYGVISDEYHGERNSQERLWSLLTPLSYGHVDMRKNVELYHVDREAYIRAERILIDESGLPGFVFNVSPRDFGECDELIRVWGDQFAEWVEDGVVMTKEEVEENLKAVLEM